MIPDFAPSNVALRSMFVGTFDRMEAENTAAVMVKILAVNGDVWRTATFQELSDGFSELVKKDEHWRRWFNNPFAKIDMHDLVNRDYAEWDGDHGIKFTDKGLERMRKWVRRDVRGIA